MFHTVLSKLNDNKHQLKVSVSLTPINLTNQSGQLITPIITEDNASLSVR